MSRTRPGSWLLLQVAVLLIATAGCGAPRDASAAPPSVEPSTERPFSDTSPLNLPIGADPELDPANEVMIQGLARESAAPVADIFEFGFGIYEADESTPRTEVTCRMDWGPCPFAGKLVPLTSDMVPPSGSDGQISVIDRATGTVWEMWQYDWQGGRPVTSWGGYTALNGSGFTRTPDGAGASRGSGFSVLAGVVRVHEIQQGWIPHALEFSTNKCQRDVVRPPAHVTDGRYTGADAIPEGARLQLDPTLDLDTLPGITPAERAVGKALQVYGAYAVDCGGAPMALGFELPEPGEEDVYRKAGLEFDYAALERLPISRMRVLASWDSGASPIGG